MRFVFKIFFIEVNREREHSVKSVYTFFIDVIMGTPTFHYCTDNVGGIVRGGLCTCDLESL